MNTKARDKEYEKLEATGEGTVAQAKEVYKELEKEKEEQKQEELGLLEDNRRHYVTYNQLLATLLIGKLRLLDWMEWTFQVAPTDKGIVLEMQSPDKRYFRAGFKPTGLKEYDLNAIEVYVQRAENTLDRIRGADQAGPNDRQDSGIGTGQEGINR